MKRRLLISPLVGGLVLVALGGQWLLGQARDNGPRPISSDLPGAPAVAPAPNPTPGISPVSANPTPVVRTAPVGPARQPAVAGQVPSHRPSGYHPQVATGTADYHGQAAAVACMTCHTTKPVNLEAGRGGVVPAEFHQKLVYKHGEQSCLSCHNSQDYDALRLADGRKLAFAEGQKLCQQCHGPQARDYLNGAHGGMNGYWDKTKGPRTRNTCTDCHDPHAPAYPVWTPVFAPIDAGARQQRAREEKSNHSPESPHHE